MRTTLTIEDKIAEQLKEIAHQSGKPFKQVVNEALRTGLANRKTPVKNKQYRLKPASLGEPLPGYNLDKALELSDHLEDSEIARKLALRK